MKLTDRGIIYDAGNRPEEERVASFVSLCRLSSGALMCGFQLGRGKHDLDATIRFCRSTDQGQTWTELPSRFSRQLNGISGSLSSGEIVEISPQHLLLYSTWFDRSDPERPLFDPETQGILHSRQLLAESVDDGETWSEWREFPIPELTGCSSTGPILSWPDGRISLAFESYKHFDDPAPATHGAWLITSHNNGQSFDAPQLIARDPEHQIYYWDQRLCRGRGDDDAVAMFWTHHLEDERDLTVHLRHIHGQGKQASPIIDTGIPGQIAAPLLLPDGRLLALVVDRSGPMTMKLWQSHDQGQTWPNDEALLVYEHNEQAALTQGTSDVDYAEYWSDMLKWSFGHPAIQQVDDSTVLLAFYAGAPGCLSIHGVRVQIS